MSATCSMALWLGLSVAPAQTGGDLSGNVADEAGAAVEGIEVRVWSPGDKGWQIHAVTYSDLNGEYAFTDLPADDYLLDGRMGPTLGPENYADRWYDKLDPKSDGWLQVDADAITIEPGAKLTGYDLVMLVVGGLDGCVVDNGTGNPVPGLRVRFEQAGERRIHHNDLTHTGDPDPNDAGCLYLRGLVPSDDYRAIISDPTGVYPTTVVGPYTITSGTVVDAGQMVVDSERQPDPYEDNDSAADTSADTVNEELFGRVPPEPFSTAGSFIGPVDDPDFYCFHADAGARFRLNVTGFFDVGDGATIPDPFFDPVLGWWSAAGAALLATNDDAGLGSWDSELVAEVGSTGAGRYCAVVSTYPDVTLTGNGPGSAGTYVLDITPLNRRPTLGATYRVSPVPLPVPVPVPVPPETITTAEGYAVEIDLTFSDADGDPLSVTATHADSAGGEVSGARFEVNADTATWTWEPDQVAARGSPYDVTFEAADGELAATVHVVIEVEGVNTAPEPPTHVSPADTARIGTTTPELRIINATDADLDTLVYEFELRQALAGPLFSSDPVAEDPSGETSWRTPALLENTGYTWQVRAFDGHTENAYSPRTTVWGFFVDVANDPPAPPVMTKPDPSQTVLVRDPTLVAMNPTDPERDPMQLTFEVGLDPDFVTSIVVSPPQTVETASTTTAWRLDKLLDWSTTFYARAFAVDNRDGRSDYSNVLSFSLRENQPPPEPQIFAPYDANCDVGVDVNFPLAPITVTNVEDSDGDEVWLELEIYDAALDPDVSSPVFALRQSQSTGQSTNFVVDSSALVQGNLYLVRARADDDFEPSDWDVCSFVARGNGGKTGGCDCRSGAPGLAALLASVLLLLRGRLSGSRRNKAGGQAF